MSNIATTWSLFGIVFYKIFIPLTENFIKRSMEKYTDKVIIVLILIHSSICVLKFKLPSMQTNFYQSYPHQVKGWAGLQ